MSEDILRDIQKSQLLNPMLVKYPRLLIMRTLHNHIDGCSYTELKAVLGLEDGNLYANLKALKKMHLISEDKNQKFEGRQITVYTRTQYGLDEYNKTRKVLREIL